MTPLFWGGLSPRVRGNLHEFRALPSGTGLSPRVRGNPVRLSPALVGSGSIPACAGEPVCRIRNQSSTGVYPRVCGGTGMRPSTIGSDRGLSPRVRGNLERLHDLGVGAGSIPACAGEPAPHGTRRYQDRVYPRVCGGTTWLRQNE